MTDERSGPSKRRAAVATADQALNGFSSFVLTVAVARVATPDTVGVFALSYLTVQIVLSMFRTGITQPFMVRRATVGVDAAAVERSFMAATTWVALVVTAVALPATLLLDGESQSIAVLLAVGFPFLSITDGLRYVAISRGRPGQAVAIDCVRVAGIAVPVVIWTVVGEPTAIGVLGIRCGELLVSMTVAIAVVRLAPHRPAIAAWWHENKQMSLAYGGENVLLRVSTYSVAYGLVWFATLSEVAGFRAGSTLTNLITVLFASVPMVLLPHYRHRMSAARDIVPRAELMRIAGAVSATVAALTAAGSVVLLNLPDALGRQLFGDTWELVVPCLPGLLFWTAGSAANLGPLTVLRATARTRQGVVARTVQSLAVVLFGFVGAALDGATGAAWGLGIGAWIGTVAWFQVVWADGPWDPRTDAIAGRDHENPPPTLVTSG